MGITSSDKGLDAYTFSTVGLFDCTKNVRSLKLFSNTHEKLVSSNEIVPNGNATT
jgi:hypothetical protein